MSMGKQFSTKELKACSGEKKTSTINGARKNWKATCKRMKLNCYLSSYTKVNSKWIKDLNIKPETIIYAGEKIGTKLTDQCIFLLLRAISWILFVAASNP